MFPASDTEKEHSPISHEHEPFVRLSMAALAAPLLWVMHFAIVYLLEGFLCTREAAPMWVIPGTILVATAVFGGVCGWIMLASDARVRRAGAATLQSGKFLVQVVRVLAGLALVAIMWSGAGAIFLSPCSFAY
jgi:hypothetical protein